MSVGSVVADIPRMTWGPTVISCEKKPNRKRRHDGWELSELTGRRRNIDRPLKNTARGELEAPVAIDPKRLQFRFTHRLRHDRAPVSSQFIDSYIRIGAQGGRNRDPSGASRCSNSDSIWQLPVLRCCLSDHVQPMNFYFQIGLPSIRVCMGIRPSLTIT